MEERVQNHRMTMRFLSLGLKETVRLVLILHLYLFAIVILSMAKTAMASGIVTPNSTSGMVWTGGTCCGQNQPQYIHNPPALVNYFLTTPPPNTWPGAYTNCPPAPTAIGQSCFVYAWYTNIDYTSQPTCPANSTGTPATNPTTCTCNDPYVSDSAKTSCVQYSITLSGGSSIEPWNKGERHDPKHLKANVPYTATVTDAAGQVSPNIEVTITMDVTQDSGGHTHVNGRPKGKLKATPSGTPTPVSTVDGKETITGNTDSNGTFLFTFGAEEASGTHTITATCTTGCKAPATAKVNVAIQGLSSLDSDPLSYDLQGSKEWHSLNHYFSADAMAKILNLAFAYSHSPDFGRQLLIINDSSLIKGGVFDIGQDWTDASGHAGHRKGVVVDINNYRNGRSALFERLAARFHIDAKWEGPDVTSTPHYHLWLLGRDE